MTINNKIAEIKKYNINNWVIFYFLIYLILVIKFITIKQISNSWVFSTYSIAVSIFLLSRFALAFFNNSNDQLDSSYEPTVTFGIPAKNEEKHIMETLLKIAQSDYPTKKMEIIAVNDGSTDRTLDKMREAKKIIRRMGIKMKIINWKKNRGKRNGMAKCVKKAKNEIMVFIDSDSFVTKNTVHELVKYFSNKKIGAVAGHAYVANAGDNMLTRMQAVRYFVSFKAFKAAESIFGLVTCCSGCCAAYRQKYIKEFINEWLNQKFLGARCTFGDDRSLTNFILKRGYEAVFSPTAISYTVVPNTFKVFSKQQLRWKKSWTRESLNAAKFIWKKNPIASISFYLGFMLPFLAPVVVVRALIWYPFSTHNLPLYYLLGLFVVAVLYGIYYYAYTKDHKWFFGSFFTFFYSLILIWQLPYAILTIRDSRWGTR